MDDFSGHIENCTSLSQLDDWLQDFMPDPRTNAASISPTPVVQIASSDSESRAASPANTRDQSESAPAEKIKINVEYRFYFLQVNKPGPSNTRVALKKRATGDPDGKYKKLVLDAGRISFDWDFSNQSLKDFKLAAIDAIRQLNDKQFATHAQAKDEEEKLGWLAAVPHGGIFAEKNKTKLNDKNFLDFLDLIEGPQDGRIKYTITLVETDPRLIAQKKEALKFLQAQHGGNPAENNEDKPSPKASVSAKIMKNIAAIKAAHHPVERLTGSLDVNVYLHPSNDDRFIALDMDCIALWACTMIENPEVTLETPPVSPSFPVVTKAEYYRRVKGRRLEDNDSPPRRNRRRISSDSSTPTGVPSSFTPENTISSSSPNVSMNNNSPVFTMNMPGPNPAAMSSFINPMMAGGYMGHLNPMTWAAPWAYGHHPMMYPGPHQPAYQNENTALPPARVPPAFATPAAPAPPAFVTPAAAAAPNSSPVPYDMALDLNDYLQFVDVEPTEQLSEVMHSFGINRYTGFALVKADELEKAGIKLVPARLLVSRVKEYERHLKASRTHAE
ncbi:hypothetical protein PCANC_22111 [Puccinia coronata f. sp. avenae]|uniref:SAM domain-containing protein n=1 Tax=Puccinia coronata f. sp. avenae TaxID=200324 RepID=A0A2N5TKV3_9BASI|nr:hypothetical protein PCANC_22111 [Puccinia coronata f. sp. avenae]